MKLLAGVLRTGFAASLVAMMFMLGGCADSLLGTEPEAAPELRPALPPLPEATPLEVSEKLYGRYGAITIPAPLTEPDSTGGSGGGRSK